MKTGFIIAISVICGVSVLLGTMKIIFSSIRRKLNYHIQERFDKKDILVATTRANSFGELSKGGKQLRGNGALALTKNDLFFVRAMPVKEYDIPIKFITRVSMPKSFNGKSVFARLLCVQYNTDSGTDAMAWAVKDPEKWKKAIEGLIKIGDDGPAI